MFWLDDDDDACNYELLNIYSSWFFFYFLFWEICESLIWCWELGKLKSAERERESLSYQPARFHLPVERTEHFHVHFHFHWQQAHEDIKDDKWIKLM